MPVRAAAINQNSHKSIVIPTQLPRPCSPFTALAKGATPPQDQARHHIDAIMSQISRLCRWWNGFLQPSVGQAGKTQRGLP
jgi:hypothetical protein